MIRLSSPASLSLLIAAMAAAGESPVAVSRVGYVPADAAPESGACGTFDPGVGVAWDYGNRSLVIELEKARWVTRILVTSDIASNAEPKLKPDTVSVYTSPDNVVYTRYGKPFAFKLTRSDKPGEVWRAEFSGLELYARYIKLKQTYNDAEYGFGISNLKRAVQVFADAGFGGGAALEGLWVDPAQTAGAAVTAFVRVAGQASSDLSIGFEVQNCETWETLAGTTATATGSWAPITIPGERLTPGGHWLKVRLLHRQVLIDEKEACFRIHAEVVEDAEEKLPDVRPGGAWVLRDLRRWCEGGQEFAYKLPHLPARQCRGIELAKGGRVAIKLPIAGERAVYVAVGSPWPDLKSAWGGRTVDIPTTQADWPAKDGVQEHFIGFGDFTTGPLTLESPLAPARIWYIRAARPDAAESELIRYQADPTHNRRVIYNNDGFTELWGVKGWDKARLIQLVERYAGTDTEIFEMAALVSSWVNYPSQYATFWREGEVPDDQWVRANDKMAAELFRQLEADGLPIFPTLSRRGRELGIPVFGSLRMSAYYGLQEKQTMQPFNGKLWHEHPEMRIRRRDGQYEVQMSFAWEAVRNQRLGVLRELLEMGCEGVMMDFCRYPDILGYDEPLVGGFKAKYGVSPLDLPDNDERWLGHRCDLMNDFFRAVRRQTDEIAEKQGRNLRISVRVPATGYRQYGFDPDTWAKERLMDIFIPHYPGLEKDFDVRPWVARARPAGIKVYPGIEVTKHETSNTELTDAEIARGVKPGIVTNMSRDDYRRKAWKRYRRGADGVFLFNCWTIGVERNLLGDKRSLQRWSWFEDPMNLPRQESP